VTEQNTLNHSTSRNQYLAAELRRFATFDGLRHSQFYREFQSELKELLCEPRVYRSPEARPRLQSFLRVVEWNIERGSRIDGIIQVLNTHPVLQFADLLLINELDDGMVRSSNLNVARELSAALSTHAVFGVEYLELTKGTGAELKLEGENTTALHGNAILTRHSFSNPEVIRLPRCENNFESAERRLGGRIGILVDLEIGETRFIAGNTHLDVVNTPKCRATQMRAMLRAVDERFQKRQSSNRSAIVGGDLNTHTFARGSRYWAIRNTATILGSSPDSLRRRLSQPERREPAIREFARFGYETESCNDQNSTSRTIVSNLDDPARLPRPMKWWVRRRVGPEGLLLEFRLDWLATRGLRVLKSGEVKDEDSRVKSVDAQTVHGLTPNGAALSDHDPIVVDIALD
jgi:endonuclease/exonuclease/phosphatase family metal-dependent hydrolase